MLRRRASVTKKDFLNTCVKCNETNSARWKCITCNHTLCESCKKSHGKKFLFKSHSFVNLTDSPDKFLNPESDVLCPCKGQSISLYCTLCSELVCVDCIAAKHNGHTFEKLESVNEQQKAKIQSIASEIEGVQIPVVKDLQEKMGVWRTKHMGNTKRIKDEIIRRNVELKEQIDGWTKTLLLELEDFSKVEQRKALDFQPNIQKRIKRLLQEKDRLRILAQSNDTKLLLQGVNDRITDWETMEIPSLNDVQYLPGPDILSNFPSPLGSFMFTPQSTDNGYPSSVSPTTISGEKTIDFAFNFLENEEETPTKSTEILTDLSRVTSLSLSGPDLIWIGDLRLKRLELVRLVGNKSMHKLTQLNLNFLDLSLQKESESLWVSCLEDNSISVVTRRGKRKCVNVYQSLIPTCVFVTDTDTILVGFSEKRNLWVDANSIRKVVEIHAPDTVSLEIERDQNGKTLFTFPLRCCANSRTGDILAIDSTGRTTGRVVICNANGHLKHIYTGNPSFVLSKPFDPTGIACVSFGNIVVCDHSNQLFHVLDSEGQFLRPIKADDIGVEMPYSVACDGNGNFCVGNWPENDEHNAKLYLLDETIFTSSKICV